MDRADTSRNVSLSSVVKRWELWSNSGAVIAYVLLVDFALIAAATLWPSHALLNGSELFRSSLLLALSVGYEEVARRIEVVRIRFGGAAHADMTSVWSVAAAIALPVREALVVIALMRAFMWFSYRRGAAGNKLFRQVFTFASVGLSTLAVDGVLRALGLGDQRVPGDLSAALVVVTAIATFTVVNRALVSGAICLTMRTLSIKVFVGGWPENAIEFATLSLGGITAVLLLGHPWLVILVLAPLGALQRSMLVKQFQEAAMIDSKTGLLNAVAWQQLAGRELARASRDQRGAALLMLDIDHFKAVNDRFGHLAGDAVLRTVAEALKRELRDYDTVGRFGGEEFVVLLPDTDIARSILVAQRLRNAIGVATTDHANLAKGTDPLTVSVGVACFPMHGLELEELMRAADSALYRAKALGRDRVVLWSPDAGLGIDQLV